MVTFSCSRPLSNFRNTVFEERKLESAILNNGKKYTSSGHVIAPATCVIRSARDIKKRNVASPNCSILAPTFRPTNTMRSLFVIFALVAMATAFRSGRLQYFNSFSMMCASDECVPSQIKTDIKTGWTKTGNQVWDACVTADSPCTMENKREISRCVFGRLSNITDITVKEARETWEKFSMKGMEDCCEDKITVGMVQCAVRDARRRRPSRPRPRPPVEDPDSERVEPLNNRA